HNHTGKRCRMCALNSKPAKRLVTTTGAAATNQITNQINKLVSIKLGTLLSSQTTTTPSHTPKPETNHHFSPWRSAPGQLFNLTPQQARKQNQPNQPAPPTSPQENNQQKLATLSRKGIR